MVPKVRCYQQKEQLNMGNGYRKSMDDEFGASYDSDEDLTPEERRAIKYADDPQGLREQTWDQKPAAARFSKIINTIWSGDKRRKPTE